MAENKEAVVTREPPLGRPAEVKKLASGDEQAKAKKPIEVWKKFDKSSAKK